MSTVPRGSYGPAKLTAQPKTVARRNPQLLAMAAGRPCLLRVPGVCNGDPETTVACHSNLSIHEKGGHRKADDCYSVWGCARCHTWLDSSYSATGAQRAQRFMGAHLQQVLAWRRIAEDAAAPEADRKAAQWALDQLNATPVAQDAP
ncbi:nuclease domain-containing protein [Xylophilus rhododendri]|nr:nuclease domain-containing protein [Xylophilus rhododendri]